MGSPLGPTLANIFVGSQEAVLLEKMSRPLFYCGYVDDCFAVFKTKDESSQFHCHFNQMHSALQFTSEGEENDQITYLDVMVMCKNGKILNTVFRKPTFSGQCVKCPFVTIAAKYIYSELCHCGLCRFPAHHC